MATGEPDFFKGLIGRELNQTYKLERIVGRGGMAAVFKGKALKQESDVAIKIVAPELANKEDFVKRFLREAKVGNILSHPNIVKVFDYGQTEDGIFYMAMEFVSGETLEAHIKRSAPLTLARTLEILKPLCEALEAAHSQNVLHRDMKPSNVILSRDSSNVEIVKLTDFGLVKLLQPNAEITKGSNLTGVDQTFGTPHYMAPEQILGAVLNSSADVYALGVVVYQMLTDTFPITSTSTQKLLSAKLGQDPLPPSQRNNSLPQEIDKVLLKVLSRNPKDRYQTAKEFLNDFEVQALPYITKPYPVEPKPAEQIRVTIARTMELDSAYQTAQTDINTMVEVENANLSSPPVQEENKKDIAAKPKLLSEVSKDTLKNLEVKSDSQAPHSTENRGGSNLKNAGLILLVILLLIAIILAVLI